LSFTWISPDLMVIRVGGGRSVLSLWADDCFLGNCLGHFAPQCLVMPALRLLAQAVIMLPQVHLQCHRDCPPLLSAGLSTVNWSNCCPVISIFVLAIVSNCKKHPPILV